MTKTDYFDKDTKSTIFKLNILKTKSESSPEYQKLLREEDKIQFFQTIQDNFLKERRRRDELLTLYQEFCFSKDPDQKIRDRSKCVRYNIRKLKHLSIDELESIRFLCYDIYDISLIAQQNSLQKTIEKLKKNVENNPELEKEIDRLKQEIKYIDDERKKFIGNPKYPTANREIITNELNRAYKQSPHKTDKLKKSDAYAAVTVFCETNAIEDPSHKTLETWWKTSNPELFFNSKK